MLIVLILLSPIFVACVQPLLRHILYLASEIHDQKFLLQQLESELEDLETDSLEESDTEKLYDLLFTFLIDFYSSEEAQISGDLNGFSTDSKTASMNDCKTVALYQPLSSFALSEDSPSSEGSFTTSEDKKNFEFIPFYQKGLSKNFLLMPSYLGKPARLLYENREITALKEQHAN